jgi:hypothetical protein
MLKLVRSGLGADLSVSDGALVPASAASEYVRAPLRLAMAGGRILGVDALMLGFRDDTRGIEWDFGPPRLAHLDGVL